MHNIKDKIVKFAKTNQIGMALVLSLLLFVVTVIINPKSFNLNAFGSIASLTAMLAIASAGQTLVVVSDGIDMSVGATMSLSAILSVAIMQNTGTPIQVVLAFVAVVALGAVIGLSNGLGAVKVGLPPMVVTLYISNIVTRLQYVTTGGAPTYTSPPMWMKNILTARLFGFFPVVVFFALAVFAVMFYLMNKTRYGRQLYLVGSNNRAAYLNGIRTDKMKITNYVVAGVLAGIAGFIGAGNSGFIKCGIFDAMTMDTIVAVVVGGTLLSGGFGKYQGTAAGALLLIVLSNSLSVLQVNDATRNMIMGIVLIGILTVYNRAKKIRE